MATEEREVETRCVIPCLGTDTRQWQAWDNVQPPPPNTFRVTGEVLVPNPGVEVLLVPKMMQGINPAILLMDLILIQQPGNWTQNMAWLPACYELTYGSGSSGYTQVNVFCGDEIIADIPVETAH